MGPIPNKQEVENEGEDIASDSPEYIVTREEAARWLLASLFVGVFLGIALAILTIAR